MVVLPPSLAGQGSPGLQGAVTSADWDRAPGTLGSGKSGGRRSYRLCLHPAPRAGSVASSSMLCAVRVQEMDGAGEGKEVRHAVRMVAVLYSLTRT